MRTQPLEYDPVVHGYSVALANKYDIISVKDVVKILKWIHHKDSSEEYAKEFMKKLLAYDFFLHMQLNIKGKITAKKLMAMGVIPQR
ncbi:hypothetical protein HYS91_05810 [Candidatus Daviesbacteria bacterium]|nr:hypothetical protein [Candidatus Daviesbacteria bacterium]